MSPKILVPIDDSPTAEKTINSIIELKEHFPKNLALLHVIKSRVLLDLNGLTPPDDE